MFHIQIPKQKMIQLSQLKKQPIVEQKINAADQKKPSKVEFQSIFKDKFRTIQLHKTQIEDQNEIPLVEDCLNVVGEEHPESDGRRDEEKKYSAKYSNSSDYWEEHQFRAKPSTFLEEEQSEIPFSEKLPFADKFTGRFLQYVTYIEAIAFEDMPDALDVINEMAALLEKEDMSAPLEEIHEKESELSSIMEDVKSVNSHILTLWAYLDLLEKEEQGLELLKEEKEQFLGLRKYIIDVKTKSESAVKEIEKFPMIDFSVAEKSVETFKKSVSKFKLASTKSPLNISPDITIDEVTEMRSISMHQGANSRWTDTGVWKIGEKHIEDIQRLSEENKIDKIKYNLVTRKEFNDDFFIEYPELDPKNAK